MTAAETNTYRAGIVGLGWMGWLYDVATRPPTSLGPEAAQRGMPPLRPDADPPPMAHPGREGLSDTYAGAITAHPRTRLVAGCETDQARLVAFGDRYGVTALYTDHREMLEKERLDFLAVCTTTAVRPEVTVLAAQSGVKAIATEKPMASSLAEADLMVDACKRAGVPLACGAISVAHPAFAKAKQLVEAGEIGRVLSLETSSVMAQHNAWIFFVESQAEWVLGVASDTKAVAENREFAGAGIVKFRNGLTVSVRPGAPFVRLTGERGELVFDSRRFRLWRDVESAGITERAEVSFPQPQMHGEWSPIYLLDDLLHRAEEGGEPRVSGRRVRDAMEIEIALRESHRHGNVKVDLPLRDRSLSLVYDWFR